MIFEKHAYIPGVKIAKLNTIPDARGRFTEAFRLEWQTGIVPIQWNIVHSTANVLRGVHVHIRHLDYFVLLNGTAQIALVDLRESSPAFGKSDVVDVHAENLSALVIPVGMAHGFYLLTPSIHMYSVSEYYNTDDELGCRWDDPALQLRWTPNAPLVSPRDASAISLQELMEQLKPHQATWKVA